MSILKAFALAEAKPVPTKRKAKVRVLSEDVLADRGKSKSGTG